MRRCSQRWWEGMGSFRDGSGRWRECRRRRRRRRRRERLGRGGMWSCSWEGWGDPGLGNGMKGMSRGWGNKRRRRKDGTWVWSREAMRVHCQCLGPWRRSGEECQQIEKQ